MEDSLLTTFEHTSNKLIRTVAAIDAADFNKVPFEGSWTPAQVADHIFKSQSGLPQVLNGTAEATDRKPEEKKENIKKLFLDFSIKMKSPDFILPEKVPLDKEALIRKIESKTKEIIDAFQQNDLKKIYPDFELPGSGKFTGLEWGWFAVYHTQRHIHQLENIHKILVA